MVAAENRQLWNRLTKLTRTNKSLGNQLTKISDTLKQHSPAQPSEIVSYNFRDVSSSAKQEDNQQCALSTSNGLYFSVICLVDVPNYVGIYVYKNVYMFIQVRKNKV